MPDMSNPLNRPMPKSLAPCSTCVVEPPMIPPAPGLLVVRSGPGVGWLFTKYSR
jgi:hypothetical protein